MAYEQYSNYPPQARPAYNQAPPRGASRGAPPPRGPDPDARGADPYARGQDPYSRAPDPYARGQEPYARGPDPYGNPQGGFGQERGPASQSSRVESYAGYDDLLDQYGDSGQDPYGSEQQYQKGTYGPSGYDEPRVQQSQAAPPLQYRDPPQRRDNYGPPQQQGYGRGDMNYQSGRGRGPPPPREYGSPANHGPPRGGMGAYNEGRQQPPYEDGRQYPASDSRSPPRQKPKDRLLATTSPQHSSFDNPFPVFPTQTARPKDDVEVAERAMAGVDLNGRPSMENKRPPTSGSQNSQNSARPSFRRQPSDPRAGAAPRSSGDEYGPRPSFEQRGPIQRSMTMPQDLGNPGNNNNFNEPSNAYNNLGYDVGLSRPGPQQDPIQQRSYTTAGDRPGPMQTPNRPSTATGMRPQGNGMYSDPRSIHPNDGFGRRPAPPPQTFMPPRPGTSQEYREGPNPGMQRGPPPRTKEAALEAYMPDFDAQSPQTQRLLQDPIGLPLDAAPEAGRSPTSGQPLQNLPYDLRGARSQPNLRGQANGYNQNDYAEPVPAMPPVDPRTMNGQQRPPQPRPLMTDTSQMPRPGYAQTMSPNSPRQFHRPGAPPVMRNGTNESGWSDPGQGGSRGLTPNGTPGPGQPAKPVNPDALPAFPAPIRPGAASIRQEQSKRMSDSPRGSVNEKRVSGPITVQELYRLKEAVKSKPQDQAQQLYLAKKLVEASSVLANEEGRADARTAQKNRENYIFEAHKIIKKLVSNNYPDAMFYLADCYGTGQLGLSVDPKEAFMLYQQAAKVGHGPSAYRTAVCCEMGQENGGGTRKDPLKAVQWYRRAAALGDTPAMYKLGMILLKGHLGQAPNLGESMIWLQRAASAANAENPHALHELAIIYETAPSGGKVIRDDKYALELYTQAAKLGYRNSQARLGKAYEYGELGVPIDNRSSIHWYSKAAAQEDHDAELALSGWYLTGSAGILEQNDQEAYLWARKAGLAENPKAEFAMGYFSETGIGCPKSFEDAKRWYGRAAGHRYPKARERLEELMRSGSKGMKSKERISRSHSKHEDCVVM